jgi:hypothetical protein
MFRLSHDDEARPRRAEPVGLLHNEGRMKMREFGLGALLIVVATVAASAQSGVPVPRPFPGAPVPPASVTPPPAVAKPPAPAAAQTPTPAAPPTTAGPELPGVPPLYPTAEYLESVDAGSGQRYYLYGASAAFADIVSYYRTVTKNGGREIYRTPGMHQFDLGRFNDDRMVYPPSVVVKDYSGGTTPGYLYVAGTEEKRYRTIIQIVPPGAE